MRVLARIPELAAEIPAAAPAAKPCRPAPPLTGREPERRGSHGGVCRPRANRRRQPPFPTRPVIALGLLAAFAWSLASWNEFRRVARNRQERLARVSQTFSPQATTR